MQGPDDALDVRGDESLAEMLEKVRRSSSLAVRIDLSKHPVLREQPHIRKIFQSAAVEVGKSVTFHTSHKRPLSAQGYARSTPRVAAVRHLISARDQSLPVSAPSAQRHLTPFVLAVCASGLLTSVVLFILPRAWVNVRVTAEPLVTDVTINLDTSATTPRRADGVLPARHVSIQDDIAREFPIETIQERGNRARGLVDLVNTTDQPQGVRAGTRLTNGADVVLRIQRGVIVPPHGRAAVSVIAEQGGVAGNLSPQRLTLPGLPPAAQRVLYAESVTSLSGGTERLVRVLTNADLVRAMNILRADAEAQLHTKLQGDRLLERHELYRLNVELKETSRALGAESETVRIRAHVSAEALTTNTDGLQQFLTDILRTRSGPNKDIAHVVDLQDFRVIAADWNARRAEMSVHVETTVLPDLFDTKLRARLAGQTVGEAQAIMNELPGVRETTVVLSPWWVRRVPSNPRNIHLRRIISSLRQ